MDLDGLHTILRDTTVQLRKGEKVIEERVGSVRRVDVYAMPHESEAEDNLVKVDCHFIVVGVDKAGAEQHRDELIAILKTYPAQDRLAGGPSYIEVGAEIGDQGAAFQLFALGEVLGLWQVITPKTIGVTGTAADQLAGSGMVMISEFKA